MNDDELRKIWRTAGGSFHGPNIETGTMPESQLLPFLRSLSTTPTPISDQAAGEPAKLAKDLENEQTYLASCRDMCSQDDELPRWDRLQRAINYLRALSTGTEHSAIYISKRLTGSDADASFVQAHINQAVSEAMDRSTAPTTGSAPSRQMLTQTEIASCILPGRTKPASPAASALSEDAILAIAIDHGLGTAVVESIAKALLAASMGGDKS